MGRTGGGTGMYHEVEELTLVPPLLSRPQTSVSLQRSFVKPYSIFFPWGKNLSSFPSLLRRSVTYCSQCEGLVHLSCCTLLSSTFGPGWYASAVLTVTVSLQSGGLPTVSFSTTPRTTRSCWQPHRPTFGIYRCSHPKFKFMG